MKKIIYMYLAFLTKFALLPTDVMGNIIQRPSNAATSVDGEIAFNCSSDNAVITWLFAIECNAADGETLTASNCDINSSYADHYSTEKSSDGFVCNLTVLNVSLSLGGCYICSDGVGTGHIYEAMLIVVDTNANMTSNSTDIIAGDDVTISNSVSYRGPSIPQQPPPLPPQFYWTSQSDPTQNITSYQGSPTHTSASSYITVNANPPNVGPYSCNLFFNPPTFVPNRRADNVPIYSKSWESPNQLVSYPPETVTILGSPTSCLHQAVDLTCSASGHPIPTYKWFNLTNMAVISDMNTVRIERGGSYQCVASNTIRNVTHNASESVYVSDCAELGISDAACMSLLAIVIYFGLNLLFFTIFMTCYGCSKSGRNKLNDKFDGLEDRLPCMNDKGCKCSWWIFFFVLLSIFAALIFYPIMLIKASCSGIKNKGQSNTEPKERNGKGAGSTQLNTLEATKSPSPELFTGGTVYAELGVDNQQISRRPIQPIQGGSNTYAEITSA